MSNLAYGPAAAELAERTVCSVCLAGNFQIDFFFFCWSSSDLQSS